jgi:hypothetical protein
MKKLLTAAICAILASAALVDPIGPRGRPHVWLWWILQAVLAVALAVLLRWYVRSSCRARIRPIKPRTIEDIPPVPESEAYELQRVAGRIRLSARQARVFALAILEPAELRQRVAERYIPAQRTLSQEVTVEAQLPSRLLSLKDDNNHPATIGRAEASVLFPVLVLPKGALTDNLEVYNSGAARIPLLSYREYLQLTAGILRLFLCLAYGISAHDRSSQFPPPVSGTAEDNVGHLEHRALCEIIKRAQANADVKRTRGVSPVTSEANSVAELLEKLPVDDAKRVYLRLAAALVRKLSLHYALVASTLFDGDGRLFIRYQRTLIPELELSPDDDEERKPSRPERATRRLKGWLRTLFGARPVNVTVSLDNAWTCQSYHIRVEAPEGLYLARQEFVASKQYIGETDPPLRAKNAPTPVHYRFRRRLGQSYAHFYGRFFPTPIEGQRRPNVQLDFFEVPPGSDFRAGIAGLASFGLVWLVGFVMSRTNDPGTDAPAFLLVFPGVAASWLGFDAPAHRLFEGTLAARLSLALTTLISVTASGLFILNRSGISRFSGTLPFRSSILGVDKWSWAALTFIAFFNVIYMIYRWLRQAWLFKHLAERQDPDA